MAERFDAVVVGAGPAGSAAALVLAKEKFSVLLVERGRAAGSKNMFGGRIYAWPLFDLLPEWQKDCPVERFVTRESLVFLSGDASLAMQFENPASSTGRAASFTALRPKFDEWLGEKGEAAGGGRGPPSCTRGKRAWASGEAASCTRTRPRCPWASWSPPRISPARRWRCRRSWSGSASTRASSD